MDKRGQPNSEAFRAVHGHLLGGELAKHQGEIGDDQDDDGNSQCLTVGCQPGNMIHPGGQLLGNGCTADRTGQDADQGDADLDR